MSSNDVHITPSSDIEKGQTTTTSDSASPNAISPSAEVEAPYHDVTLHIEDEPSTLTSQNKFLLWTKRFEQFVGLEARGIHRVKETEKSAKTTLSFWQIVILWISINAAAQNITLASIGQSVFGLGFVDATLMSVFGGILGSIPAAYTATWGPWSGNRTLVRGFYLCCHSLFGL